MQAWQANILGGGGTETHPWLLTHPRSLTPKRETFNPSAAVSWASSSAQTWGVLGCFAHPWLCTLHCRGLAPSPLQVASSSAYTHSCPQEQIKTFSPLISCRRNCLRNLISCLGPGGGTQPCPLAAAPGSFYLALLWPGISPCVLGTSCFWCGDDLLPAPSSWRHGALQSIPVLPSTQPDLGWHRRPKDGRSVTHGAEEHGS